MALRAFILLNMDDADDTILIKRKDRVIRVCVQRMPLNTFLPPS